MKTIFRFYFIPVRMAIMKTKDTRSGKNVGKEVSISTTDENIDYRLV